MPPAFRTVLIGMKPEPSVGMSAKNSTLTASAFGPQVPAGSTIFTARWIDAGAPGGSAPHDSPAVVMVAVMRIGTPVCVMVVSGLVQLVVPSHCITEAEAEVKLIVWNVLSRPAVGNALDDAPQ